MGSREASPGRGLWLLAKAAQFSRPLKSQAGRLGAGEAQAAQRPYLWGSNDVEAEGRTPLTQWPWFLGSPRLAWLVQDRGPSTGLAVALAWSSSGTRFSFGGCPPVGHPVPGSSTWGWELVLGQEQANSPPAGRRVSLNLPKLKVWL